jgi:hypothetical protein
MLNNRKIEILHLEPTNVCQAACSLCLRETDQTFNKSIHRHLTFEQIVSVFDQNQIANLNKMFMCGNYGDPAAGQHTIEIFQKFRNINPKIVLGMNTNGALQNVNWWKQLAAVLCGPLDYVVFSIDGLEDTNHIYRKNVVWNKLIENIQAFVGAGGVAHWDMLVYQHNQHQVDEAVEFARTLGFSWFRAKVSKRPLSENLQYPVNWKISKIQSGVIDCMALNEHSIYIDSSGIVHPCCWQHTISSQDQIDLLELSWHSDTPDNICKTTCTKNTDSNNFINQWRMEIQLK